MKEINTDGKAKTYVFDAVSKLIESYDELGGKTSFTYDLAANRLTQTAMKWSQSGYMRQLILIYRRQEMNNKKRIFIICLVVLCTFILIFIAMSKDSNDTVKGNQTTISHKNNPIDDDGINEQKIFGLISKTTQEAITLLGKEYKDGSYTDYYLNGTILCRQFDAENNLEASDPDLKGATAKRYIVLDYPKWGITLFGGIVDQIFCSKNVRLLDCKIGDSFADAKEKLQGAEVYLKAARDSETAEVEELSFWLVYEKDDIAVVFEADTEHSPIRYIDVYSKEKLSKLIQDERKIYLEIKESKKASFYESLKDEPDNYVDTWEDQGRGDHILVN